ncbi:hypothetical protein RFI_32061 [Reticulomyxa filosa]|uniref:Uncharacterized protein n=1 Tax=Reticulomyxa filosa TaxID=46433 RepID=X6LTU9_RETFI|nr:hypothetical protein RFI_32061 [Reticulomyxa filosa]|eukprot:ETO05338.1 hypothetical protein RFI_32061 [Reticulomyxa filosa]
MIFQYNFKILKIKEKYNTKKNFDDTIVYEGKNDFNKALEYHENALNIRSNLFGDNHNGVADSYDYYGNALCDNGNYNKAIKFCQKALKIKLNIFGINDENIEKYEQSIRCYEQSLNIRKFLFGNINRSKTACKYYENAWKVYTLLQGEWNSETISAKENVKQLQE